MKWNERCPYCYGTVFEVQSEREHLVTYKCTCGLTFDTKRVEMIDIPHDQVSMLELMEYKDKRCGIHFNNMEFEFAILTDSAGLHPIWFNDKFTVYASIECEGKHGLFMHADDADGNYVKRLYEQRKPLKDWFAYTNAVSNVLQSVAYPLYYDTHRAIPFRSVCPFCMSPVLQTKDFATCESGCPTFKIIDGKAIIPLNQFTMQELLDQCGNTNDTIKVAGMEFNLDCLEDAIGYHPIWQNDTYTIFASLMNPDGIGGPGLYIDVCKREDESCLGYAEEYKGTIDSFEMFKTMCEVRLEKFFKENNIE